MESPAALAGAGGAGIDQALWRGVVDSTNHRDDQPYSGPWFWPRVGRANIFTDRRGTYEPHPDGRLAAILAVHDSAGEIVDAVSWAIDQPSRWWLRRGLATMLGAVEIERAAHFDVPLYLISTPQDWALNAYPGGRWPAACVLSWYGFHPAFWFSGLQRIVCDSEALAARLRAAERKVNRPLAIFVKRRAMRHAA